MGIRELTRKLKNKTFEDWLREHDKKPYHHCGDSVWICLEAGRLVDWVRVIPEKEKQQANLPARIYLAMLNYKANIKTCMGFLYGDMQRLEKTLRSLGDIN